ncbi:MAG: nucleoside-triphosphate--adenylate kinase, adenylate kinase [Candidatus Berkelbacteria bacterium]|nr:nucleoside-triphosphate--adenylate kinase, adenylate kinase [Candidatus Berkelbacteria bacterium]
MFKKYFIILGPPGSGKGTQAKNISQEYELVYFGTGDLMREESKKGSEVGLKFKKIWDEGRGALIPENLVQEFVNEKLFLLNLSSGVIFDGYPRTTVQAEHLDNMLKSKNISDYKVLNLVVSDEFLINRMSTRRICATCGKIFENPIMRKINQCDNCQATLVQRSEDKPEILKRRISVYNEETAPLIDYYERKNKLINIDGEPSIDDVWKKIQDIVND